MSETGPQSKGEEQIKKCRSEPLDPEEYILKKRLPKKLPKSDKHIYVTKKTQFKAQLECCEKLLDGGLPEITIHGLGDAVNRAINLALQLQINQRGSLQISCATSTVELIDDLVSQKDDIESRTQQRYNSAIHIKASRISPILQ